MVAAKVRVMVVVLAAALIGGLSGEMATVASPGNVTSPKAGRNVIAVHKDGKGDLTSVREAIAFSEPGDIIEIQDEAAYVGDLKVPAERTIRAAAGKDPKIHGNIVMGNKTVLEGLTIEPLDLEIWGVVRCNRVEPEGCVVRNCRISGKRAIGLRGNAKGERPILITVWESSGVQIVNNVLSDGRVGIWIERYSKKKQPKVIILQNNDIQRCSRQIRIDRKPEVRMIEKGKPVAPPAWEAELPPGKRKDYAALHRKYSWLQDKLDRLPPAGGVVKIPAGVHDLYLGLLAADRKNITLRGAGKDKTTIRMLRPGYFLTVKRVENVLIERLSVKYEGKKPGRVFYFYDSKNCRIVSVRSRGVWLDCCDDFVITRNDMEGSLWFTHCWRIQVTENTLQHSGGSHVIDLNGDNHECLISRNNFSDGYSIHVYSGSNNNIITDNVFTKMRGAINIMSASNNLVARNIIRQTCKQQRPAIFINSKNISNSVGNRITGNIIYNNRTDAIKYFLDDPTPNHPRVRKSLDRPNRIERNVIYGNDGTGIDWTAPSRHPYDTPIVRNNIVVDNKGAGIAGSRVQASFNNVWNNQGGDYRDCKPGKGAISADPLFADPAGGDFHLKSKAGRWDPKAKKWVKDTVQSPCIDAGDPKADFSREPAPNGGRSNIGAYGNTKEASKSGKKAR